MRWLVLAVEAFVLCLQTLGIGRKGGVVPNDSHIFQKKEFPIIITSLY